MNSNNDSVTLGSIMLRLVMKSISSLAMVAVNLNFVVECITNPADKYETDSWI